MYEWTHTNSSIVERNDLAAFKRLPSFFRRYLFFLHSIKASHGSVMNFIMQERVKWTDVKPQEAPFRDPSTFSCSLGARYRIFDRCMSVQMS
jgi:hypothetical protein